MLTCRKRLGYALTAILAGSVLASPLVAAQGYPGLGPDPGPVPLVSGTNQIIVQYLALGAAPRSGVSGGGQLTAAQVDALSAAAMVELDYVRPMSGGSHVLRLPQPLPEEQVNTIAQRLLGAPGVAHAEADALMYPHLVPSDPLYPQQWHYYELPGGVNAPVAWDFFANPAVVAVLDTGATYHPDLLGRYVPGYDMIWDPVVANDGDGRDPDASDPGDWVTVVESSPFCPARNSSWHGTHVAGTIGASLNGVGGVGLHWLSFILPVRVLGKCGGYLSDIADGIIWAAGLPVPGVPQTAFPARVINMSLGGGGGCGTTYQNAIDAAVAQGTAVVVSAGNSNADASQFRPANCNNVITVAATNRAADRAYYSNFGATVEIAAPGGEMSFAGDPNGVLSTLNTGTTVPQAPSYAFYQGTSMAAPHVSGIAALLYGRNPTITPAALLQLLQETARPFPPGSTCTGICGAGIVDAGRAVAGAVLTTPTLTLTGCPGETVNYPFTLSNFDNAAHSFMVDYSGNLWPFAGPAAVGPIAGGGNAPFTVAHTIAPTALPGQTDTLTVTATAQDNPAITTARTVTTQVATGVSISSGPPSPNVHMDHGAAFYGGELYVIGGLNSGGSVDIFDPVANTWSSGAAQPGPNIEYPIDIAVGNNAAGEQVAVLFPDATGSTTQLQIYNFATNGWSTAPLPAGFPPANPAIGIWAHDIACNATTCYITGGATTPGGGNLNTFYAYNVAANTLTPLPPFTTARDFHASFFYNNWLCIAGGVTAASGELNSTQCFDFIANAWRAENADLGTLPTTWWGMADGVVTSGGQQIPVLAGGSGNGFGLIPNIAVYQGGSWQIVGTMPSLVYRLEGAALGNRFYIPAGAAGGFSSSNQLTILQIAVCGNQLPVANAGPDQTAIVNTLVTLDGSGSSDPEGQPITYAWTQTGGPEIVTLNGPTTVNPTFTPTATGVYTFDLVVNDGTDNSAPDDVVVTVNPPGPTYDLHFRDNGNFSDLCINSTTGQYLYATLTGGVATVVRVGVGTLQNWGGTLQWTDTNGVWFQATYYMTTVPPMAYATLTPPPSTLLDSNTTDNGPCTLTPP